MQCTVPGRGRGLPLELGRFTLHVKPVWRKRAPVTPPPCHVFQTLRVQGRGECGDETAPFGDCECVCDCRLPVCCRCMCAPPPLSHAPAAPTRPTVASLLLPLLASPFRPRFLPALPSRRGPGVVHCGEAAPQLKQRRPGVRIQPVVVGSFVPRREVFHRHLCVCVSVCVVFVMCVVCLCMVTGGRGQ